MKRIISILFVLAVLVCCLALSVSAKGACGTATTDLNGSNVNENNYTTYGETVKSHLTTCSDGRLMTVSYVSDLFYVSDHIEVSYYTSSFALQKTVSIALELPLYGGFYESDDAYYVVSGQENKGEDDSVEVIRVTKYNKSWKRLGSASLYGANTTVPFEAGSVRMAHNGKVLYVRTCHEMYASKNDGLNHQANVTFSVDTSEMSIIDQETDVMNEDWGYVSHSFNQFIKFKDGKLFGVDHGDGYPRSIVLMEYIDQSFHYKDYHYAENIYTMHDLPGLTGANDTYASVGGVEITDDAYIVVGNSQWHLWATGASDKAAYRNIFVSVVDRATGDVSQYPLTYYTNRNAYTPHLVKISDSSYMVMWGDGDYVYYQKIDSKGQRVGDTYHMEGDLSDCVPVVINGKVTWYTFNRDIVTFYTISTSSLSKTAVKAVDNSHTFKYAANSKSHWKQCADCGYKTKSESHSESYYSFSKNVTVETVCGICNKSYKSRKLIVTLKEVIDESGAQRLGFIVKAEDGEVFKLYEDYTISTRSLWYDYVDGNRIVGQVSYSFKAMDSRSGSFEKLFNRLSFFAGVEDIPSQAYTGKEIKPEVTVKMGGKTLENGVDYTVSYKNNVKKGTATVTITGKDGCFGTITKTFKIVTSIKKATVTGVVSKAYTGKALTQKPKVVLGGKTLKKDTDYTISYKSNTKVGTATMTIKGKGSYAGTITKTFKILTNIADAKISGISSKTYTGKALTQSIKVTLGGKTLKRNTDYKVTYENNTKVGKAKVIITGMGKYAGSVSRTFKITRSIKKAKIEGLVTKAYTGKVVTQKPKVILGSKTLKKDTDYTVSYKDNVKRGTATIVIKGKGNYSGTITATFKIVRSIKSAKVTGLGNKTYTGSPIKPTVKVTLGSKTLKKGTDYTVSYKNNTKVGEATVTIKGKGNYAGTITETFKITRSIKKAKISGVKDKSYSSWGVTQSPTVTLGGKTLKKGTDYTISYKNADKIGTATMTIKGKGSYTGSVSKTFKIKPAKIGFLYVYSYAYFYEPGEVKLIWSTDSKATGYEVVYSTSSSFDNKKITVFGDSSGVEYIKGLTPGKTYYFKVRTYTVVKGATYYGAFSDVQSIVVQ